MSQDLFVFNIDAMSLCRMTREEFARSYLPPDIAGSEADPVAWYDRHGAGGVKAMASERELLELIDQLSDPATDEEYLDSVRMFLGVIARSGLRLECQPDLERIGAILADDSLPVGRAAERAQDILQGRGP